MLEEVHFLNNCIASIAQRLFSTINYTNYFIFTYIRFLNSLRQMKRKNFFKWSCSSFVNESLNSFWSSEEGIIWKLNLTFIISFTPILITFYQQFIKVIILGFYFLIHNCLFTSWTIKHKISIRIKLSPINTLTKKFSFFKIAKL